jgi:hypothetical protein
MAEWGENGGERLKPACAEVVNLLLVEIETEMPGVLSLARTRYRVAQNLSSFWAMTNFRFAVQLTTRLERGPTGEWYMVEFQRGEKFEAEQRQALAALYQQTKGWQLAALASELTLLDIEEPRNGQLTGPKSEESLTERATLLHGEPETGIA